MGKHHSSANVKSPPERKYSLDAESLPMPTATGYPHLLAPFMFIMTGSSLIGAILLFVASASTRNPLITILAALFALAALGSSTGAPRAVPHSVASAANTIAVASALAALSSSTLGLVVAGGLMTIVPHVMLMLYFATVSAPNSDMAALPLKTLVALIEAPPLLSRGGSIIGSGGRNKGSMARGPPVLSALDPALGHFDGGMDAVATRAASVMPTRSPGTTAGRRPSRDGAASAASVGRPPNAAGVSFGTLQLSEANADTAKKGNDATLVLGTLTAQSAAASLTGEDAVMPTIAEAKLNNSTNEKSKSTIEDEEDREIIRPRQSSPASPETREVKPRDYKYKIKALYSYTADPTDPKELSFEAGELLVAADVSGPRWWNARKSDGKEGIVPSNYMEQQKG